MSRHSLLVSCLFLATLPALAKPLKITAYINVASGCQRPTEALLAKLDETYGDKVVLEVIDFGKPAGAKRWQESGLGCMAILLDGKPEADIVFRGAEIRVSFSKPAGFFWLHEELETAVRQRLEGVNDTDRQGPDVTTTANGERTTLVVGGTGTYASTDAQSVQEAAVTLGRLAKEKPLTQEDFSLEPKGKDIVALKVRGGELLSVPVPVDATDARNRIAIQRATAPLASVINAYPCLRRPFRFLPPPPMRTPGR